MSNSLTPPQQLYWHTVGGTPPYEVERTANITDTTPQVSRALTPCKDKIVTITFLAIAEASHTLAGTLTLEVSNSSDVAVAKGTDVWTTYDAFTSPIPAISITSNGAQQIVPIELVDFGWYRFRLRFVPSSGQGTVGAHAVVS